MRVERANLRGMGLAAKAADDARRQARTRKFHEGEARVEAQESWRAEQRESWARRKQAEHAEEMRIIPQRKPLRILGEQARARMAAWRCGQSSWSHPGGMSRARSCLHEAHMEGDARRQRREFLDDQLEREQERQRQSLMEAERAQDDRRRRWRRERARANQSDEVGRWQETGADAFLSAQGQLSVSVSPATTARSTTVSEGGQQLSVPRYGDRSIISGAAKHRHTHPSHRAKLDVRLDRVHRLLLAVVKLSGPVRARFADEIAICERQLARI